MQEPITNETIWTIDWARRDRQAFLRSLPRPRKIQDRDLAAGLPARGIWMRDVSAMDRRSVKAQLAGRGDYRTAWWNINAAVHRLLAPHASAEAIMFAFHKRHHSLTIHHLLCWYVYRTTYETVLREGVRRGIQAGLLAIWRKAAEIL